MDRSLALVAVVAAVVAAAVMARAESDFKFYNIVMTVPGEEARVAREILDTYEKTGIDTPLVSMSLHPEGKPAWEKVVIYLTSYRALKKELAGSPVKPGILIQSILGHWPRQDKEIEPWTRSVSISGAVSRFCPLDPGFRKYIRDCAMAVAKERPSFIMTDDDVRANRGDYLECFCPLHTAEFNRRTGRNFTPAQYRAAVKGCKNGDAVFTAFDQLRRDMLCDILAIVRGGINAVDPEIPTGVCMPGSELRAVGEFAKTLADGHPATVRVANALYLRDEWNAKNLIGNVLRTMSYRQGLADIESVLEESDTFPHSLYAKSALAMHTKLCTSAFVGINGSKIWLIGATKHGFPVSKRYTEILGKHRDYYPALARIAHVTKPAGVVFPARTNFHSENAMWYGATGWFNPTAAHTVIAGFGVPVRTSFDCGEDAVYVLTGADDAWRFSDAQIKQLLSGRVLIDGAAARVLTERGYAELLGVSVVPAVAQYNRQYWTGTKKDIPINYNNAVELKNPAPGAETITELFYAATYMTKNPEKVGPGCVAFMNKLGGTVVTTVWNEKMEYASVAEATRDFFIRLLDRLGGGQMAFTTAEARPVLLLQRDAADGAAVLQIVNLGFDPMDAVRLRVAAAPVAVERLAADGTWEAVGNAVEGGVLTVDAPLACYESVVLKVK